MLKDHAPSPLKIPENMAAMSTVDLLSLKLAMETRIDEIRDQLAREKSFPTRSDPEWYLRAQKAKAVYGRDVQRIQLELKRRNEVKRNSVTDLPYRFLCIFLVTAERRLSGNQYNEIMKEAQGVFHGERS